MDGRFPLEVLREGLGEPDEIDHLGQGTFGSTYRVVRGGDEYAVKVIHLDDMPGYLWDREITTLSSVAHRNVVAFRGSGSFQLGGRAIPYLECDYVPGGSIRDNLDLGRRPTSSVALRALMVGLLSGVRAIHRLGILHRDIKPANVALQDGDWARPVLLDFGLAKSLDMSTHTAIGQAVGTAAYMAPEQLRGDPARKRSDLFSVGVLSYEAGTGRHPFLDPDIASKAALHDRIRQTPPHLPPWFSNHWEEDTVEVVMRLLSYAAHERLDVDRALSDLGASTCP